MEKGALNLDSCDFTYQLLNIVFEVKDNLEDIQICFYFILLTFLGVQALRLRASLLAGTKHNSCC